MSRERRTMRSFAVTCIKFSVNNRLLALVHFMVYVHVRSYMECMDYVMYSDVMFAYRHARSRGPHRRARKERRVGSRWSTGHHRDSGPSGARHAHSEWVTSSLVSPNALHSNCWLSHMYLQCAFLLIFFYLNVYLSFICNALQ